MNIKKFVSLVLSLSILSESAAGALAEVPAFTDRSAVLSYAQDILDEETASGSDVTLASSGGSMNSYEMMNALENSLATSVTPLFRSAASLSQTAEETGFQSSDAEGPVAAASGVSAEQALLQTWAEQEHARFSLDDARYSVEQNLKIYKNEDSDDDEKTMAYLRIYRALGQIDDTLRTVSGQIADWKSTIAKQESLLQEAWSENPQLCAASDGGMTDEEVLSEQLEQDLNANYSPASGSAPGSASGSGATIRVHVLNSHETGISLKDANGNPISGASVRITNALSDTAAASASAVTDAQGVATVNLSPFPVNEQGFYVVNAVVTLQGYRTWRTFSRPVQGGKSLGSGIVLQADNGQSYIEGVTLRDADVFHSSDTIYVTPKNDAEQKLVIYLHPNSKQGEITISYVKNGKDVTESRAFGADTSKVEFSAKWCQILTVGSKFSVTVTQKTQPAGRTEYPLSVVIREAVVDEPWEGAVINPNGLFSGLTYSKPISNSKYFLKSIDFSFAWPDRILGLKPMLYMNPNGVYRFGLNLSGKLKPDKDTGKWKLATDNTMKMVKAWDEQNESILDQMAKSGALKKSGDKKQFGTVSGGSLTGSLYLLMSGQAIKRANVKDIRDTYKFDTATVAGVAADLGYSFTKYFLAWCIPLYAGFDFNWTTSLSAQFRSIYNGQNFSNCTDFAAVLKKANFMGVLLTLGPSITLFCGAGIRGFVSLALEGTLSLLINLMIGGKDGGKTTGKFDANVALVLHLLLVKAKMKLIDFSTTFNIDSDSPVQTMSAALAQAAGADGAEAETVLSTRGVPSDSLQVSATLKDISSDQTGTLCSATTSEQTLTIYSKDGKIHASIAFRSGKTLDEVLDLSYTDPDFGRNTTLEYYEGKAMPLGSGDGFAVLLLGCRSQDRVDKQVTDDDGTVRNVTVPTQARAQVLIFRADSCKPYSRAYVKAAYNGTLNGLCLSEPSYIESESKTCLLGAAFDPYTGKYCYFEFLAGIKDKNISLTSGQGSLSGDTIQKGSQIVGIAAACKYDTAYHKNKRLLFLTTSVKGSENGDKHLYITDTKYGDECTANLGSVAVAAGGDDVWMVNAYRPFFATERVTSGDHAGQYRLVMATAFTNGPFIGIIDWKRFNIYLSSPEIKIDCFLGANALYWLDTGVNPITKENETPEALHEVKCCLFRIEKNQDKRTFDTYLTPVHNMMTFDNAVVSPENYGLSDLTMNTNLMGYRGEALGVSTAVEGNAADKLVSFEQKQVLESTVDDAMIDTPLVEYGSPVTGMLNLRNSGNTALRSVSIQFRNPNQENGAYAELFIDFADSSKNSMTVYGADCKPTGIKLNGELAACTYDGQYSTTDTENLITTWENGIVTVQKYNMLLPGQTRAYRISFYIPKDWGTGEMDVKCVPTRYQVQAVMDRTTELYSSAACFAESMESYDMTTGSTTASVSETAEDDDGELLLVTFDASDALPDGPVSNRNGADSPVLRVEDEAGNVLYDKAALTGGRLLANDAEFLARFAPYRVVSGKETDVAVMPSRLHIDAETFYEQDTDGNWVRMAQIYIQNGSWDKTGSLKITSYVDDVEIASMTMKLSSAFCLDQENGVTIKVPLELLTRGTAKDHLELRLSGTCLDDLDDVENIASCYLMLNTPEIIKPDLPQTGDSTPLLLLAALALLSGFCLIVIRKKRVRQH